MFGRLFRGKSRLPRPEARTAGEPASPYAPLFEEPVVPPAKAGPPAQSPPVAMPEPLAEPPAPPSEPPPVPVPKVAVEPPAPPSEPVPELLAEPTLPSPVSSAPLPPREPPRLLEEPLLKPAVPGAGPDAAAAPASSTPVAPNGAAVAAEPLSAEEHAAILAMMRVAPDIRYRAARSVGLLGGLEDMRGAALEHAIVEQARAAGKLAELAEVTSR